MNRRDFIGAAIGALVAALLLPFEDFAAWCRRWFKPSRGNYFDAVKRVWLDRLVFGHAVVQQSRYVPDGNYWLDESTFPPMVIMHPNDVAQMRMVLG